MFDDLLYGEMIKCAVGSDGYIDAVGDGEILPGCSVLRGVIMEIGE